jgi:hypothetical protein
VAGDAVRTSAVAAFFSAVNVQLVRTVATAGAPPAASAAGLLGQDQGDRDGEETDA